MIRAETCVQALAGAGFGLFSGTPCSYLKPLVNRVIDAPGTGYVGVANEGEAVAVACGAWLGGRLGVALFQNSGLGNAVNPLTSLAAPFRIPLLLIVTWRGQPRGPADEPQHALMGRITPGLLDLMEIPWEDFPDSEDALGAALGRAGDHLREQGTPYALVLRHGVIPPYGLETPPACASDREVPIEGAPGPGAMDPDEALRAAVAGAGGGAALIATTGYTGRALYGLGDRPNQLYMVGSMGCASSLGLGLARAQPGRRVVVLDGDGAVLMRLGALATLGQEVPANLIHVVLDNGVHDSTGGQATASGTTDLARVARACGYPRVVRVGDAAGLAKAVAGGGKELTFVHVRTRPRDARKLPRPEVKPEVVARRFRRWLGGYA